MPRIRWETEYGQFISEHEWRGYLGKVHVCTINLNYNLDFHLTQDGELCTKLSSAKRGAERMLQRFLDDARLEEKESYKYPNKTR